MRTCLKFFVILSLILFATITRSDEIQPGLRVAVRDSTIKTFETYLLPIIYNNISTIKLNDTDFSVHVDFLGEINLSFKNLFFHIKKNLTPEQIQVVFNNNNTFSVIVNDLETNIEFDYSIKTNFYNNQGKGNATFSNLSMIMKNYLFAIVNKRAKTEHNLTSLAPAFNIYKLDLNSLSVIVNFNNKQPLENLIVYFLDNFNSFFVEQIHSKN